jgi:hypothetical protein
MKYQRSIVSLRVGDVEIQAIEEVDARVETVRGVIAGVARKTPVAVIVRTPAGEWRVDLAQGGDPVTDAQTYAARLQIEYPERLDRLSTFFRLI